MSAAQPDAVDRMLGIDPADPIARLAQVLTERDAHRMQGLRSIRARAGISIAQVADALNCDVHTIHGIEQNEDCYLSQLRRYELAVLTITPNQENP